MIYCFKFFRCIYFFLLILFLLSCSVSVNTDDNFKVVELPDGSVVYLNNNSSIQYTKSFNDRNLELIGEAFFIIEEKEIPFTITTYLGEIVITGTELNVKVDDEKGELEVDVAKGNVEVKVKNEKKLLNRGERITFNRNNNSFKKSKSNQHYKIWLSEFDIEMKALGKDINKGSKALEKETKKVGKKLKKLIK